MMKDGSGFLVRWKRTLPCSEQSGEEAKVSHRALCSKTRFTLQRFFPQSRSV